LPRARVIANAVFGALGLGVSGCGLLDVGLASEITRTEPVSFRVEVVELGPFNPERVAFPSDAPVAEFLPGDRVRLAVEVVDTDGLALADEQLDSVWFLFGTTIGGFGFSEPQLDDPELAMRCDELEAWTLDTPCRLGEGRGSIEFEAPPLGDLVYVDQVLVVYAVVAWNGQSAEECWTARRDRLALPSDCGFLRVDATVGPPWWLIDYAASQGVFTWLAVGQFPAAVFGQQANRTPVLQSLVVEQNGEIVDWPVNDGIVGPIEVTPGELVSARIALDPNLQFSQSIFYPLGPEGDLFTAGFEVVRTRVSTTGAIQFTPIPITAKTVPEADPILIQVDEEARPGLARALLVIRDHRGAESVVRVEFEIQ
jgi:hypothetical protein